MLNIPKDSQMVPPNFGDKLCHWTLLLTEEGSQITASSYDSCMLPLIAHPDVPGETPASEFLLIQYRQ